MAPSTLEPAVIQPILDAAMKMARQLKYAGPGTFEFLVNARSHEWIFLEINPRIQVEHTVTGKPQPTHMVINATLTIPCRGSRGRGPSPRATPTFYARDISKRRAPAVGLFIRSTSSSCYPAAPRRRGSTQLLPLVPWHHPAVRRVVASGKRRSG